MLKAGFKEIDYTPIEGYMPGEYDPYYARGSHLPLQANAAAFSDGESSVILIAIDLLLIKSEYGNGIRSRISEATGVPAQNIIIACSHTHTGANITRSESGEGTTPGEPEVTKIIADRIVKAGIEAFSDLKEISISYGTTEERRYSFCRDWVLKDGSVVTTPGYDRDDLSHQLVQPDYSIEVMRVEQNGKVVAIMVNYANHPDCHRGYERNKFSPDYPGFMREALKNKYGRDVVVLFFNGACGDINDRDHEHGTDRTGHRRDGVCPPQIIGEALAEDIAKIFDSLTHYEADEKISTRSRMVTVKHRQMNQSEIDRANELKKKSETEYLNCYELVTLRRFMKGMEGVPDTAELEVLALKVGPWAIVTIVAEVYTIIGRTIKENSPFEHTIISELTNGSCGYLVVDGEGIANTYEGGFGSGDAGEGSADTVIKNAVEMLNEIYKEI